MKNDFKPDFSNAVWAMIEKLSIKSGITEIAINSGSEIFIEKNGLFSQLDFQVSEKSILDFIQDVSIYNRKDCDANSPIFDGSLPDGSRINIVLDTVRKEGPAITIRRFLKQIQTFNSKKGIFGLNQQWVHFLQTIIKAKLNIIVAGGTGVGKTTFLNLLLQEIDPTERIITIEDTRELNFTLPNVIRMETAKVGNRSITIRDLVKNSLRMRPDRIVVGEVRGEEVFDLLQAMNSGHDGCVTSVHANTPADCLSRLESLYMLSGYDIPNASLKKQIGNALDFIIQLHRNRAGVRVVSHITEVTEVSGTTILMQNIGTLGKNLDYITSTGLVPKNIDRLQQYGLHPDQFKDFF